jgi:hypothetical protein
MDHGFAVNTGVRCCGQQSVTRVMFSDPNSMGSAWQVWVWGNLSSEEWQDSTCEHGEGVGSLVTVESLLTFLNCRRVIHFSFIFHVKTHAVCYRYI